MSKKEVPMQFHIENMTCGGCARGVTKAIQSVDTNARVTADPPKRSVEVESCASQVHIEQALIAAGFAPRTP
jgi:copper chaperone